MNPLLPVLGYCAADFPQAEKLLDHLANLKGKTPSGHILLVAAPDTHPEMHKRMEIAAHIGFAHVAMLPVGWPKDASRSKAEGINNLMRTAFQFISSTYRVPFVWLEPDAVPLNPVWLERLADEYSHQVKHLFTPILLDSDKRKAIGRVGVYPANCWPLLSPYFDVAAKDKPQKQWTVSGGADLAVKSAKNRLIQHLNYTAETKVEEVRLDAVIVHGDKQGVLLASLMEGPAADVQIEDLLKKVGAEPLTPPISPERRGPGRPPKSSGKVIQTAAV